MVLFWRTWLQDFSMMFKFQRLEHSTGFKSPWRTSILVLKFLFWRLTSRTRVKSIDCLMQLKTFLVSQGRLSGP
ncbi:hypothetical protein LINGRAHAP2_LOCUS6488 [Linum grandiflorum]